MFKSFLRGESGAQVIEYALIIAVVSIALVVALQPLVTDGTFDNFIAKVAGCLDGSGCS
ncbi:Flp family type IVb pilin [Variovorax sp. Varisp85]|uniref:Flp family type IVb pilin n=1 Tax=Variovorax sp. Varisp85 TaxID=3243059 RepID=UPI0039A74DE2